ncbi:MAG: NADH-quinone oxidoreductase subunit N [Dehalococcoidia bacterium]
MNIDFALLVPEFLLAGLAFVIFGVDLFLPDDKKSYLPYLGVAGLMAVIGSVFSLLGDEGSVYRGIFLVDEYAIFFKVFFPIVGIVMLLASRDFVTKHLEHPGEFYGLVMVSVLAMMLMASAAELLTGYIALELLSFCLYVMAAYAKREARSNEAGIKYILIGAFSSGFLLYGISLIYGAVGTTTFTGIAEALQGGDYIRTAFLAGLIFIVVGFGFKVVAVPFHMWAPDVYEGAPVPVTAYLAVASKAASFVLMLRLFATGFMPALDDWKVIIAAISALTMTVGNVVAISQSNIKRLMAYSSIGHAGFIMVGIAALSESASNAMMLYLVGYSATTFAAFLCIIIYYNLTGKEQIVDFAGLAERSPMLALALTVSLFSLAGLPFFAGFTIKFYLFTAAAREGLLWLAAIAMFNSLISVYYYLMVIKQMYMQPAQLPQGSATQVERLKVPLVTTVLLALLVGVVFLVGIYPAPIVHLIEEATPLLFSNAATSLVSTP